MQRAMALATAVAAACGCAGCGEGSYRRADPMPVSVLAQQRIAQEGIAQERMSWRDITTEPVARHRMLPQPIFQFAGDYFAGTTAPAPPARASVVPSTEPPEPDKLVVEAWLRLQTDDVAGTAAAVRARIEADGGRVISENIVGPDSAASSAALELRLPPARLQPFLDWLGDQGAIESRRMLASDVGKRLFDQELALKNLELTMTRLQAVAGASAATADLLEVEKEMSRVRGELEHLRGEQRWLLDRVAFATITLELDREGGPIELPSQARLHPGPRLSALVLLDPGDRTQTRLGGGVGLQIHRHLSLDLDVFPAGSDRSDDGRAVLATVGTALYSELAGGGRRRFLNPYLGVRLGYGYLGGSAAFVVAAEAGVELFRHRYLLVEAAARSVAFLRDDTDVALHAFLGAAVPF